MFFFLSKTLGFFVKPVSWILLCLIITVFCRNFKWKRWSSIAALAILLIFSSPILANWALKCWETPPVNAASITEPYDYGIVLGGFASYMPDYGRISIMEAGDRLWQTMYLYQTGKIKKILISGGGVEYPEAEATRKCLIEMGVPSQDILVESTSRNTHENARNTAKLLELQPEARCLLITSALHMPRSIGCFHKAGLNPDVFPVEHLTRYGETRWWDWAFPSASAFKIWERLMNEWIGIIPYKIRGYI